MTNSKKVSATTKNETSILIQNEIDVQNLPKTKRARKEDFYIQTEKGEFIPMSQAIKEKMEFKTEDIVSGKDLTISTPSTHNIVDSAICESLLWEGVTYPEIARIAKAFSGYQKTQKVLFTVQEFETKALAAIEKGSKKSVDELIKQYSQEAHKEVLKKRQLRTVKTLKYLKDRFNLSETPKEETPKTSKK